MYSPLLGGDVAQWCCLFSFFLSCCGPTIETTRPHLGPNLQAEEHVLRETAVMVACPDWGAFTILMGVFDLGATSSICCKEQAFSSELRELPENNDLRVPSGRGLQELLLFSSSVATIIGSSSREDKPSPLLSHFPKKLCEEDGIMNKQGRWWQVWNVRHLLTGCYLSLPPPPESYSWPCLMWGGGKPLWIPHMCNAQLESLSGSSDWKE